MATPPSSPLPDVSRSPFAGAPEARFEPAPADGVLPEGFFSTSNLPTYVRVGNGWLMPARPRMDAVIVRRGATSPNEFRFMATEVSRERPVNYDEMAERVEAERRAGGFLIWVVGPALVHTRARADFEWFIHGGYVQAVLAGNAVAVHDIEAAVSGGLIGSGVMHALVTHGVPYVLAGSIRDDGPLPGVLTDTVAAQDAMRDHTEFVVSKLKDRGTHQAFGVVTNAQDFMHVLRFYVDQCRRA